MANGGISGVGQALAPQAQPGAPIAIPPVQIPGAIPQAPAGAGAIDRFQFAIQNDPDFRKAIQTVGLSLLSGEGRGNTLANIGSAGLKGLNTFDALRQRRQGEQNEQVRLLNEQARTRAQQQQVKQQGEQAKASLDQRKVEAAAADAQAKANAENSAARTALLERQVEAQEAEGAREKKEFEEDPKRLITSAIDESIEANFPDMPQGQKILLRQSIFDRRDAILTGRTGRMEVGVEFLTAFMEANQFVEEDKKLSPEQITNAAVRAANSFSSQFGIPGGSPDFGILLNTVVDNLKAKGEEVGVAEELAAPDGTLPAAITSSAEAIAEDIKAEPATSSIFGAAARRRGKAAGTATRVSQLRGIAKSLDLTTADQQDTFIERSIQEEREFNAPTVQRTATAPLAPGMPPVAIAKGALVPGQQNMFFVVDPVTRQQIINPVTGQPAMLAKEKFEQLGIQF
jgi:hypothetical protein